ncbi:MAG TPA: glutamate-cysteine ligase family protein [Longimicrobiales bacterium]
MSGFPATEDEAAAWLRLNAFPATPADTPGIGAEIEFLVRETSTGHTALLESLLGEWLDSLAGRQGWTAANGNGAPRVTSAAGGAITLEPGGQLEYSAPPFTDVSTLVDHLATVASFLTGAAASAGLTLDSIGMDPSHSIEDVPLQLHGSRYDNMHAYLSAISDAGPRMMRQTAAIQVNVDAVNDPILTWSVLNRAVPVLTALFATSHLYEGRDTGCASYRAFTWRQLDASRTGVIAALHGVTAEKASHEYARFALDAPCIFDSPNFRPFRELAGTSEADWRAHLTTLFPEVRPKGYYEVRCIDALPPAHYAAPLVMIWALCSDSDVLHKADTLLPEVDEEALTRAARSGLGDAALHTQAAALVKLVLDAGRRAGEGLARRAHVDVLEAWWNQSRRDVRRSSTTSSLTIM